MFDAAIHEEVSCEEYYWQEIPTEEEIEEMFLEALNEEIQEALQASLEEFEAKWAIAA